MAWVLCFLASILLLVVPVGQNIEAMANKIEELTKLDRELAEKADAITSIINSSLVLNSDLIHEQTMCLWAATPEEKLVHQLNAEGIIHTQNNILLEAEMLIQGANIEWRAQSQLPARIGPTTCLIPGPLLCAGPEVFRLESRFAAAPGGVLAGPESSGPVCQEISWEYSSPEVRSL